MTASWAYSEQLGKNRHGDSDPARSRWYHSMARTMRRWVNTRSLVHRLWMWTASDVTAVTMRLPMDLWQPYRPAIERGRLGQAGCPPLSPGFPSRHPQGAPHSRGTSRRESTSHAPGTPHAAGDGADCEPRPNRCGAGSRTPPVRCRLPGRVPHAVPGHRRERRARYGIARSRAGGGCARSRRQTGATLGAS